MIKILFVIEVMAIGGAERVLIDIINNLNPNQFNVTVLMIYKHNIYNQDVQFEEGFQKHIEVKYICNNRFKCVYTLFNYMMNKVGLETIHRFFIGNRYDIEVAFYEGLPTMLIGASANNKSTKYAWLHTDSIKRTESFNEIDFINERKMYTKFNQIIAVSNDIKESFIRLHSIKDNVIVKYNPINDSLIKEKAKETIDDYSEDSLIFISVGRFTKIKGYDRLIRVASRLIQEGYIFNLWLIGDGEELHNLEELVREEQLDKFVHFKGFQSNPYKYLSYADVYVCSSLVEGYSTGVLEALSLKLPVITTDCPGMREIFGTSECGMITPNNEEGLYKGLKTVLSNPKALELYIQEASIKSQDISLEKRVREIQQLFISEAEMGE